MSTTIYEEGDGREYWPPQGCGRARLAWANGALAIVQAPHAWMLKELVKYYPDSEGVDKPWIMAQDDEGRSEELQLMSKYLISSDEYSDSIIHTLGNSPKGKGKGREATS